MGSSGARGRERRPPLSPAHDVGQSARRARWTGELDTHPLLKGLLVLLVALAGPAALVPRLERDSRLRLPHLGHDDLGKRPRAASLPGHDREGHDGAVEDGEEGNEGCIGEGERGREGEEDG